MRRRIRSIPAVHDESVTVIVQKETETGEYRVVPRRATEPNHNFEEQAYYTTELSDALETAMHMANHYHVF